MSSKDTYRRLSETIERFPDRRVVVIGDLIADEFLYGQIARVSREAPVLVLEYRDLIRVPGGAGNAANNLLDLGCRVSIVGAVGRDDAGDNLVRILSGKGADVQRVRKVSSYRTPVKTRILAGAHHSARQQIVRVDRGDPVDSKALWERWPPAEIVGDSDGLIISDYEYGVIEPSRVSGTIDFARGRRIPVVVDSRFRMADFHGVTSITPNITELEASLGMTIDGDEHLLHVMGRRVVRRQKLDFLLVTQGRFGMTLFQPRRPPRHIPVFGTDDVADVTGAGDTVIAVFTLALACGAGCEDAALLANYAGGIVVMKRGTATVTRAELQRAIEQDLAQNRIAASTGITV